ncbi:MAG: hypothetical protein ABIG98_05150 [Chloroflexota bacterium]
MSLAIAVYVPEGIVMASDSRESITFERKTPEGKDFKVETVNSDAVTKTFLLEKQRLGISSFGQAKLGGQPIASYIKSFLEGQLAAEDDVAAIPPKLVAYLRSSFPNADTAFHVAGYRTEGKLSMPHIYYCHIARNEVVRRNLKPDGSLSYGAAWGGESDILASILNPVTHKDETGTEKVIRPATPVAWDVMPLQDAIDFAIYAIQTTIDTMRFQARAKTVGGPIDVLALTPEETKWIQKKELRGR